MARLLVVLLVALSLAGCSRRSATPLAGAIYPYWTLAALPAGPPIGEAPPPVPTASAVLVAPGYLLTAVEGMGDVAEDFGMDPTVYVFDGTAWHVGRYVDRDMKLQVALIRADVPGTPVRLAAAGAAPGRMIGIAPTHERTVQASPLDANRCAEVPRWLRDEWGTRRNPSVCLMAVVRDLPGAAMLDDAGALAGLQTSPYGVGRVAGPDAAEIRAFLDLYFATWGSAVRPKPEY